MCIIALMKPFGYDDYKELLDSFIAQVKGATGDNLISIVLYGSVARGTAGPESDIDLLIILREAPDSYYERLAPFLKMLLNIRKQPEWLRFQMRDLNPYLSLLILSEEEANRPQPIFLDMIEEGRVLVDRDGFVRAQLSELAEQLRVTGAKKVYLEDGHWFWDLKPIPQRDKVTIA